MQFRGTDSVVLLAALLVGVSIILLAAGAWQWYRQRKLTAAAIVAAASAAVGLLVLALGGVGQGAWLAILAGQVILAAGVFYASVYSQLGRGRLAALMAMRSAAILMLLALLFKPAVVVAPAVNESKPVMAILVDRSASMNTSDGANLPGRYRQAVSMLSFQADRISENFRPAWYYFAGDARQTSSCDELAGLSASGEGTDSTNIAAALRRVGGEFSPDSLACILVVSDGLHNAADSVSAAADSVQARIYTAGVGSEKETAGSRRNAELVSLEAPLQCVRDNLTSVTARVKLTSLANESVSLKLYEAGSDQPIAIEKLWTDKNDDELVADLKWAPRGRPTNEKTGPDIRRLKVELAADNESTTADNFGELHVLVTDPRLRVLYIEGSIRPEYKYLKRLLDTDPNVQFMGLVRTRGSTFWAQGGASGRKLTAMPATKEDFKLFDVLILGDLDSSFLSGGQMKLIRDFVNDGGGLIMLGGHSSFGPGGYGGTDIEKVLPVLCGGRKQGQEMDAFLPQLTAAGEAHPVFEGIAGYFAGPGGRGPDKSLARLPELEGCVSVQQVKDGAALLAVHPSRSSQAGPLVVLAVQNFGAGRSAALTVDTTWRWYLPLRAAGVEGPYARLWGQLVRWLAGVDTKSTQASSSVLMRTPRSCVKVGQELPVRVRVADMIGRPAPTASAVCSARVITSSSENPVAIALAPSAEAGVFEGVFAPREAGAYRLEASATDDRGRSLGTDSLPITVLPHLAELDRLARDSDLLGRLATGHGGRYADIAALPELIDDMVRDCGLASAPAATPTIVKCYNFPILFMLVVVLLTCEWLLRRRWQLN